MFGNTHNQPACSSHHSLEGSKLWPWIQPQLLSLFFFFSPPPAQLIAQGGAGRFQIPATLHESNSIALQPAQWHPWQVTDWRGGWAREQGWKELDPGSSPDFSGKERDSGARSFRAGSVGYEQINTAHPPGPRRRSAPCQLCVRGEERGQTAAGRVNSVCQLCRLEQADMDWASSSSQPAAPQLASLCPKSNDPNTGSWIEL